MEMLVRVKQKEVNDICNICTREDCPFFENIRKGGRYYRACEREFMLCYHDNEEEMWCSGCARHVSDYLCLACANKRLVSLRVKLT